MLRLPVVTQAVACAARAAGCGLRGYTGPAPSVRTRREPVQTHYYTNVLTEAVESLPPIVGSETDATRALEAVRALGEARAPVTGRTLAQLLRLCFKVGEGESAKAVFAAYGKVDGVEATADEVGTAVLDADLRVKARFAANASHYTLMVVGLARLGDLDGATAVFDAMKRSAKSVPVQVYGSLIAGHARAGAFEEAHGLLGEVLESGAEPNAVIYTALIDGYGKRGQLDAARELFDAMEGTGVAPTEVTYTAMINNTAAAGEWDEAWALVDAMGSRGLPVGYATYSALMHRAYDQGRTTELQRAVATIHEFGIRVPASGAKFFDRVVAELRSAEGQTF
ncbi:auxin efflux carrier [Thecamonas trahens ATCC 50062]|uniref:Auxin efflux carrier n=1 Tax=Thecamonas trahens ATCC 50062 TaxID=461836 RepID=A0A0L0DED8_THETB|nr:auxin efflux carrier [Thecamonas trahens ATCC 50062]KNC49693.1 auxin efflux carrier [Thecamonas trahens ATCC 50062]|eukprot:XP_013757488.1 auxin efflux carrier [Thecamonas trahens ATCC 50062]